MQFIVATLMALYVYAVVTLNAPMNTKCALLFMSIHLFIIACMACWSLGCQTQKWVIITWPLTAFLWLVDNTIGDLIDSIQCSYWTYKSNKARKKEAQKRLDTNNKMLSVMNALLKASGTNSIIEGTNTFWIDSWRWSHQEKGTYAHIKGYSRATQIHKYYVIKIKDNGIVCV